MNKRQFKKIKNKISKFSSLEDVYNKCLKCQNYECGDSSVGIDSGCIAKFLFDENDNFIEENNDLAIEYMDRKGYLCPYFKQLLNKSKPKDNLPKTHSEYKSRKTIQDNYFKEMVYFN